MSTAIAQSRLATKELTRVTSAAKSFVEHLADAEVLTNELRAKWPVPNDPRDDVICENAAIWLAVTAYAAERLGVGAQQIYGWMRDDSPVTLTRIVYSVSGLDDPELQEAWHRLFDNSDSVIHLSNLMARGFYHHQHPEVLADNVAAAPLRRSFSRIFRHARSRSARD